MDSNPPICSDCGSELEDFEDQDTVPSINDMPAVPAKPLKQIVAERWTKADEDNERDEPQDETDLDDCCDRD